MKRLGLALLMFLSVPLMVTASAAAWSPLQGIDCGKAANSAVCQDAKKSSNPLTGTNGLIMKITDFIAVIAGVAAVIIIIVAGMRFVTSGGGSENVAGARRAIIYALVGIVVIILGRSLIELVLSRL